MGGQEGREGLLCGWLEQRDGAPGCQGCRRRRRWCWVLLPDVHPCRGPAGPFVQAKKRKAEEAAATKAAPAGEQQQEQQQQAAVAEEAEAAQPAKKKRKTEGGAVAAEQQAAEPQADEEQQNGGGEGGGEGGEGSDGGYVSAGKEGTAARAFQRVKADEWLDKKGAWDNSYVGTFGQNGWGWKAQEVLGKVGAGEGRAAPCTAPVQVGAALWWVHLCCGTLWALLCYTAVAWRMPPRRFTCTSRAARAPILPPPPHTPSPARSAARTSVTRRPRRSEAATRAARSTPTRAARTSLRTRVRWRGCRGGGACGGCGAGGCRKAASGMRRPMDACVLCCTSLCLL